jgi:hypothetical protein
MEAGSGTPGGDGGGGGGGGAGGAEAGEANVSLTEKEPRCEADVLPVSVNEIVSLAVFPVKPDRTPVGAKLPTT